MTFCLVAGTIFIGISFAMAVGKAVFAPLYEKAWNAVTAILVL